MILLKGTAAIKIDTRQPHCLIDGSQIILLTTTQEAADYNLNITKGKIIIGGSTK